MKESIRPIEEIEEAERVYLAALQRYYRYVRTWSGGAQGLESYREAKLSLEKAIKERKAKYPIGYIRCIIREDVTNFYASLDWKDPSGDRLVDQTVWPTFKSETFLVARANENIAQAETDPKKEPIYYLPEGFKITVINYGSEYLASKVTDNRYTLLWKPDLPMGINRITLPDKPEVDISDLNPVIRQVKIVPYKK